MINSNNLEQLADSLSELLETPVSQEILKNTTEAQRNLLVSLIYKWSIGDDHRQSVIESILNYGKTKIKKPEHSEKTKHYLANKLK